MLVAIQCGQNEVYMHHGPGCEEHCEEDKPRWCDNKRREGCFCKPGYVRCNGNGTCIIPDCDWSTWTFGDDERCEDCSNNCGGGIANCTRIRTRTGPNCTPKTQSQLHTTTKICNTQPCCTWSPWTTWSESCPHCPSCGGGSVRCTRTRTRQGQGQYCQQPRDSQSETLIKICDENCCWSNWSPWSKNCPPCPTCGGGPNTCKQTRTRQSEHCTPTSQEKNTVSTEVCPKR
ncbi:unnamed protein product, partial [Owenia fusiformis]